MKKIFIEDLPKKGDKIDWKRSEGHTIHFIYEDIEGEILIKQVLNSDYLLVQYKEKEFKIQKGHLKKCAIGTIVGKIKYDKPFKFEIGQIFKDEKRDLVIIDRKKEVTTKKAKKCKSGYTVFDLKLYKYKCIKCGNEEWVTESNMEKQGCNCCSGKKVVKGINDIATTDPWMIPYFKNKEDVYTHSSCSGKVADVICPICNKEKKIRIYSLHDEHSIGCDCKDGLYYTEKFIINILKSLNISYIFQLCNKDKKWCKNKKYDFYFTVDKEEYIIEVHGIQHYEKSGFNKRTLEEEQENDRYKYKLAISNGIKPENYIVIDFRESTLEWGKEHILNSRLSEIFELSNINWNEIDTSSINNIIKDVCEYWHEHVEINKEDITTKHLSNIFNLHSSTINKYLKKGVEYGWCNYNPKEESIKNGKRSQQKIKRKKGK